LIPKSTSDEIYLSSSSTLINVYYPKSEINTASDLVIAAYNTKEKRI
jgi:hypothetical protein